MNEPLPPSPAGSAQIARWAASRGVTFQAHPDERWFRSFEPFATMVSPARYLNAASMVAPPGLIAIVEPWTALDDGEPLDRAVLGFATHPGLQRRASMRSGETFLTRVVFLGTAPPRSVKIGDALWDAHVTTFADSPAEALAAFPPALRALLAGWGFTGHIELRPGGVVVSFAGIAPTPEGYSRTRRILIDIVNHAIGGAAR